MNQKLDELLDRIQALQTQVDQEYQRLRDEFAQRKIDLAEQFLAQQKRHKVGLWRYFRHSRVSVVLTAPFIYGVWPVFLLLDVFISLYQTVCFPIYGIPRVQRSEFMVFDRAELPYLNLVEKFNCFYCSYGNGVLAYAREVAARTEQYWCPIKHARHLRDAHDRYPQFFEHGDAEAFRQGLERLRGHYGSQHSNQAGSGGDAQPPER